jgi:hypothetical protein
MDNRQPEWKRRVSLVIGVGIKRAARRLRKVLRRWDETNLLVALAAEQPGALRAGDARPCLKTIDLWTTDIMEVPRLERCLERLVFRNPVGR